MVGKGDIGMINAKDRAILHELSLRVMEAASRPVEAEKRQLWYQHNQLQDVRPLVFCSPENAWTEIITEQDLLCEDPLLREWELRLKKELFWAEQIKDDRVIEPVFLINYVCRRSNWGVDIVKEGGQHGGAYTWIAPIQDYDRDFEKLRFPKIEIDWNETNRQLALAEEIFRDSLQVEKRAHWWWSLGLTEIFANLRGLEQMFFDFYDYPDEAKRLMAFIRDARLYELDYLEQNNLLDLNNKGDYVGSGGFGYTDSLPGGGYNGVVRLKDMWGFSESQETGNISPDAFGEFVFPYELPILERFGLNCYGCCEPLNNRWNYVKTIPNLRRVSVSPWADKSDMAEKLRKDYIYSLKPIPTPLASPVMDQDQIRADTKKLLQDSKGTRLEIIMKDTHTIGKNPNNIIDWCRIVREEIASL